MSGFSPFAPYIVAVETAVVDYHYPRLPQHEEDEKENFLSSIPSLVKELGKEKDFPWLMGDAPRGGDMRMVPAELLDELLIHWAGNRANEAYFPAAFVPEKWNAERIRRVLFGEPTLHAGGSVANTFDAMVYSKINGQALYNGDFITAVGNDDAGQYFKDAHKDHIRAEKAGVQMICHVIPVGSDRIMLTAPSFANPSGDHFDLPNQLDEFLLHRADIVMIGGFMHFTKDLAGFRDAVRIVDDYATKRGRPEGASKLTRIVTLAQQQIAEANPVDTFLVNAAAYKDNIIHGNTGEFRRAMRLDTSWRTPYTFEDPAGQKLDGPALDRAKKMNPEYQAAKKLANQIASEEAQNIAIDNGNTSFVVTNGSQPARVIDKDGVLIHETPSIDRSLVMSTVGAGDNHVAGYWIGKRLGRDEKGCLDMAAAFARAVIQVPEARLSRDETYINDKGTRFQGPIAHVARQNPELFTDLPALTK